MNGYREPLGAVPLPLRKGFAFLTNPESFCRYAAEGSLRELGLPQAERKSRVLLVLAKAGTSYSRISAHHEGAHELGHHKATTA